MEYQNGKIYKVVCEKTKRIYIGSTCVSLVRRLGGHKNNSNRCSTKDFINPTIFLIEEYPCDTKEKLLTRELYWMQNIECVNTVRPILSKEEILKQNKKYDDYSNGKIYKIECGETGRVYIGSTIKTLNKRLNSHKSESESRTGTGRCVTKDFINPSISLIEDYPCDTNTQLLMRERYYMENIECVNKHNPIKTTEERKYCYKYYKEKIKEYKQKNEEKVKEWKKKDYQKNREKILEKNRQKITCECGCIISSGAMREHKKTKKHIKLTT